jgi:hypothetical protein
LKKTFLGIGDFEPSPEYNLELGFSMSARTACFIVIENTDGSARVVFFKNGPEYENVKSKYLTERGISLLELQKEIVINSICHKRSFDIMPTKCWLVSTTIVSDNISQVGTCHTYHNDTFPYFCVNDDTNEIFKRVLVDSKTYQYQHFGYTRVRKVPKLCDYLTLEYRDRCITTTMPNPDNESDVIRFLAQRGTVLCIDNKGQMHSKPWKICNEEDDSRNEKDDSRNEKDDSRPLKVRRMEGDDILKTARERTLYRTSYLIWKSTEIGALLSGLKEEVHYDNLIFPEPEWKHINESFTPLQKMDLKEYLKTSRPKERGGGAGFNTTRKIRRRYSRRKCQN